MEINKKWLQRMYVAFGWKARRDLRDSVYRIMVTLESMQPQEKEAVIAILDEEVKKAIIFD